MRKMSPYHLLNVSIHYKDEAKAIVVLERYSGKINFNQKDDDGNTILTSAIKHGMLDLAKKIVSGGKVDMQWADGEGHSYIDIAKQYGDQELVDAIMKAGGFLENSGEISDAHTMDSTVVSSDDENSGVDVLVAHISTDHE